MFKRPTTGQFGILKKIDMMGSSFPITHNNQLAVTSSIGGLLTIVMILFLGGFFGYNIYQLYHHEGPSVIFQSQYISTDRLVNMSSLQGGFRFAIQATKNKNSVDLNTDATFYQHLNISLLHRTDQNLNGSKPRYDENMGLGPCILGENFKIYEDEFYANHLEDGLCLHDFYNATIEGKYNSKEFSFIRLRVSPCDQQFLNSVFNDTVQCATDPNEMKKYVESIVISWSFQQISLNIFDYFNPFSYYLMLNQFWFLKYDTRQERNLYFEESQLKTTEGWFLQGTTGVSFSSFSSVEDATASRNISDQTSEFLNSYIRLASEQETTTRIYNSLLIYLAALGGLFSLLLSVLKIPTNMYDRFVEKYSIIKRVCCYDSDFLIQKFFDKEVREVTTTGAPPMKELQERINDDIKGLDIESLKKMINFFDEPNIWKWIKHDFLSFIFKPRTKEAAALAYLYEQGYRKYAAKLDSVQLTRYIIELEFLKSVLLNNNQIVLFNSVCLPELKTDIIKKHPVELAVKKDYTVEEVLEAYDGISNSDDPVGKKIIENMSDLYKMTIKALRKKDV